MSPEEIKEQSLVIDYWVDEIQENGMEDAPIIIFFCTDRKQKSYMESILEDRDIEDDGSLEFNNKIQEEEAVNRGSNFDKDVASNSFHIDQLI